MKEEDKIKLRFTKLETAAANCLKIVAAREILSNQGKGEMNYSEYMEIKRWLHDGLSGKP